MSELTFAIDGDALLWTGDGEYLRIEPWGKNSVRVRASKMHEIQEQEGALLPQNNQASGSHNYGITIDKPNRTARIQFVSATLVFGLAAFDCSLAISSSHTSLGVL